MKNKVFGDQIKEEKLEIFASVPYRSIRGEGKERICERYRQKEEKLEKLEGFPANPSQILPTFCHGTKVKP